MTIVKHENHHNVIVEYNLTPEIAEDYLLWKNDRAMTLTRVRW